MALLFDDPAILLTASAKSLEQGRHGRGFEVPALMARWRLDPEEFQIRAHELCDSPGFARGSVLVTVANRRLRASRTYLSRPQSDDWIAEFERDLQAGVFSGG